MLTSLHGLEGLTNIAGHKARLKSGSNVAVTSGQGLEGVTNIAGSWKVFMNTVLALLQGLDGLKTVGGDVRVR